MKGFRTVTFNVLAVVLPVLEAADFTDVLGVQGMAVYGVVMSVANIILRALTTTPILRSE
jgi:hypothetical protein